MRSPCITCLLIVLLGATVLAQSNQGPSRPDPSIQGKVIETYGKLPLSFEANQGQTDAKVKFLSRGSGYTLFLAGDEAVFSLRGSKVKSDASPSTHRLHQSAVGPTTNAVLRMKLVKANPAAKVTGADQLPGKSNYFIGNDPTKWHNNVSTYEKVKYEGIYSGIDLVYYGNQRQLEYDFVVAPGADPHRIQFDIHGAKKIKRDGNGDLVLQFGNGEVRWHKPVVYQEKDGTRHEIDGRYVIKHRHQVSFDVAGYDSKRPLTIDPALGYSSYLGGSGYEFATGIAVDGSGDAYVTGLTASTDFPVTPGAFQMTCGGGCSNTGDAYVTEFNPTGSTLVYSTYLGGSGSDAGQGIAVGSSGNAYITGQTYSPDFPVTPGAFQTTCSGCSGGYRNAFVTELNPAGSALVYSTYLGGSGGYGDGSDGDLGYGIVVGGSGNVYVIGTTSSTNFPVTPGAFQPNCGGGCNGFPDAFLTQLNSTGSALVYSTYLGGSLDETGLGVAVDSVGDAYVTGNTDSTDFPVTPGAFQTTCGGGCKNYQGDAFVTEFNPAGSALVYSTYLGGSSLDIGEGIAVDSSGNAYVTGLTESTNFPTMNPFQPAYGGGQDDAFVTKLNSTGSALVYSTYLGGSNSDQASGIVVDSAGNTYVAGSTSSTNFPTMNPSQGANAGSDDAFVSKFNPTGSALVYSTYLGGSGGDEAIGIAVDGSGDAYVTGTTSSIDFPTTPGAFQTTCSNCSSYADAFVAQLIPAPFVTLFPSSLNFGNQNVGTSSTPQNLTLTNSGEAALTITSIVTSGDFSQTNTCPVGGSLPAGSNCTIAVTFTPTAEGTRNGSVMVTDNAASSPQSVPLTGVGLQGAVTLSPSSLNFGDQTVNTTSSPQISTLMNTGNGTLTITSIGSNSTEFTETNNCGTSVPAGGSCTIKVTFTPLSPGTQNAAVSITDNAPNSPQSLPLSGVGVLPAVTFFPTSLTFATQLVYTNSPAQKVTLTNTGLGILKITSAKISGQFGVTTNCGESLAAGASCTANVTFKPTTKGPLSGSISITDNAPDSPQSVPLTGTGTYVQLSPGSVNFGTQPVNTTSVPKYITLVNKGSSTVNFTGTGITITGADSGDFAQQNNCGSSVPSGGNCRIKVTFTPTQQGKRTADVSVSDDGGGSPQTVPLAGTGTP